MIHTSIGALDALGTRALVLYLTMMSRQIDKLIIHTVLISKLVIVTYRKFQRLNDCLQLTASGTVEEHTVLYVLK